MNSRARAVSALLAAGLVLILARAASASDPFDTPGAPTPAPSATSVASAVAEVVSKIAPECAHVTKAVCDRQNTPLILTAAAYVVVCVIAGIIWKRIWDTRGTATPGVRFMTPLGISSAVAGVLCGLDPVRGGDLACCLANGVLRAEILLQDNNMGRGFLLGVVPAAVLYSIVALGLNVAKG